MLGHEVRKAEDVDGNGVVYEGGATTRPSVPSGWITTKTRAAPSKKSEESPMKRAR